MSGGLYEKMQINNFAMECLWTHKEAKKETKQKQTNTAKQLPLTCALPRHHPPQTRLLILVAWLDLSWRCHWQSSLYLYLLLYVRVSPEKGTHKLCSLLVSGLAEPDRIDWWVGMGSSREGPWVSGAYAQDESDVSSRPWRKVSERLGPWPHFGTRPGPAVGVVVLWIAAA